MTEHAPSRSRLMPPWYLLCRLLGHNPLGHYRGYMRCRRCGARGDL